MSSEANLRTMSTGPAAGGDSSPRRDLRVFLVPAAILAAAFAVRIVSWYVANLTTPPLLLPFGTQWNDLYASYTVWVRALLQGMNPYTSFPFGLTYTYPPGFIALLVPFFLAGVPQLLLILTDAGAAVVVFLLARHWASRGVAVACGLAYALSPFFVVYEGYTPMSEEPMFFFLILALYLAYDHREIGSAVALGAALLMKQDAFFVLPVFLLAFMNLGLRPRSLLISIGIFAAGSLPALLISPLGYVANVTYGLLYPISKVAQGSTVIPISSSIPQTAFNLYSPGVIPVLILFSAALLVTERRKQNYNAFAAGALGAIILSALITLGLLDSFSYRFLLVYGFLMAASLDARSLAAVTAVALLAVYLPAGPFQAVLALSAVVAFALVQPDALGSGKLASGAQGVGVVNSFKRTRLSQLLQHA